MARQPSEYCGMDGNHSYLGHFRNAKHLNRGHNVGMGGGGKDSMKYRDRNMSEAAGAAKALSQMTPSPEDEEERNRMLAERRFA